MDAAEYRSVFHNMFYVNFRFILHGRPAKKPGDFLLYSMMRQLSCAQSALFGGNFSSGWRFLNIVTVHTVPIKRRRI